MEQLNYPVKYAILEIEEQVGWGPGLHEMEREYDVCGYIVSKVYLVGDSIRYNSDGSSTQSYQVVFPYSSIVDRVRQIPRYNLNWQCYNYINVSQVFDSFEGAKAISNVQNAKLRNKCYLHVSFSKPNWKDIVSKSQEEFDKKLQRYIEFEQFILEKTSDMIITKKNNMKNRVKKV